MQNHAKRILSIAVLCGLMACTEDEWACTMEFRTVGVEITGPDLTDYYTLNRTTADTIRIDRSNVPPQGVYPILDDTYQSMLEGRRENFRFEGWINDSLVVQTDYVIEADKCHINYVSGPLQITL
jgi:hypothetical protein